MHCSRLVAAFFWVLSILFLNGVVVRAADDAETLDDRFAEVRQAFDKGSYKQARYLAETLDKDMRKQGKVSPALYELMGHIRYREGALGDAALWYERASLFPPPVPEVRQNLNHIHARTGSLIFAPNDVPSQLSAWLSRSRWLQIAILCGWLVILSAAACMLYVHSSGVRAVLLVFASGAFIAGSLSLLGWYFHPSYQSLKDIALVTAADVHAYTAASSASGTVTELPPGSEVRQIETRGAWAYVEIPAENGTNRGWVQSSSLAPLWPDDYGAGYLN